MASQGPNNPFNSATGQAQMTRDSMQNQPSDVHNQGQSTNFLQETGSHVTNMAHGASEVGKGAALGAASLARGAAQGAANVAQGAANAIKNTFGMSNPENTSSTAATNNPLMDMSDPSTYPTKPSYAHTPNTNI